MVLLTLSCAPALGDPEGPDVASRDGVVAPETASGEPTPENSVAAAADPGAAASGAGDPADAGDGALDLAFLGVHLVWGALAGLWLWKRRSILFQPKDDTTPVGTTSPVDRSVGWLLLAGAVLVWFSMGTGAASAQVLFGIDLEEYQTLRGMVLVNGGGYLGGLLALGFLVSLFRPLLGTLGRRPRFGDIPRALGAYVIAHPLIWLIGWLSTLLAQALAGPEAIDPLAHETLQALRDAPMGVWWVLTGVIAVVAAPVLEELIYRGMVQNGLMRLSGSPGLAIGGSALVFSLMHYSSVAPHALPTLFALGVAFGMAYNRTRCLAVPIVMHATFNAINLAMTYFWS